MPFTIHVLFVSSFLLPVLLLFPGSSTDDPQNVFPVLKEKELSLLSALLPPKFSTRQRSNLRRVQVEDIKVSDAC